MQFPVTRPPLVEITDRPAWDRLVESMPGGFFTQLWEWGELRRSVGWEVSRLVWPADDQRTTPVAAMQIHVRRAPIVGWGVAHIPRGPLGAREDGEAAALTGHLRAWARDRRVGTVVVDPDVDGASPLGRALLAEPWRPASDVGENRVHILDLEPGTDPWAGVRRKHREWIRKAEKAGVHVAWVDADTPPDEANVAMDRFEAVYAQLVDRLGLGTHGPAYTRRLFERFRVSRQLQLATAMLGEIPVAAMLHVTFGDTMVWYAGGQSDAGAPVGAGKLLLWRAIQRAHELGFRRYHMWGTATDSLAHYKEGFGAREERYLGTRAVAAHPIGDGLVRAVWGARQAVTRLRRAVPPGRRTARQRAARAGA